MILLQEETRIAPDDTSPSIWERLSRSGADLMVRTLEGLNAGKIEPRKQDQSQASLAPVLKREDGQVDFCRTAQEICNRIRGFQPWPGAFTQFRNRKLNIIAASSSLNIAGLAPGNIAVADRSLVVGCGENTMLEISEVQPEGKKRMSAIDFANGYKPQTDERFGAAMTTEN